MDFGAVLVYLQCKQHAVLFAEELVSEVPQLSHLKEQTYNRGCEFVESVTGL